MTKHVQCPHCGQAYALTLEQVARLGGQMITCSQCNSSFLISKDDAVTGGLATEPTTFETRPEATAGAGAAATAAASLLPPIARDLITRSPPPTRPGPRPGTGWAIASLIFGLLAIFIPVIPGLIAILLGLIALRKMRNESEGGGLAVGGITIAVMGMMINSGVLFTYVLPTLKQRQDHTQELRCQENLRKIASAMRQYANESDGRFPDRLESILATQHLAAGALVCPTSGDAVSPGKTPAEQIANLHNGPHVSYTYAGGELTTQSPPECVLLYEELNRHENGMWVIFVDGRIDHIGEVEAAKAIRRLRQGQNPPWTITPKSN